MVTNRKKNRINIFAIFSNRISVRIGLSHCTASSFCSGENHVYKTKTGFDIDVNSVTQSRAGASGHSLSFRYFILFFILFYSILSYLRN